MFRSTVFLNGAQLKIPADLCATLLQRMQPATLAQTSGTTSSISDQVKITEFPTMNLSAFFLAHLALQAPKSSLIPTGLSQRTSTASSMQTATSLKTSFTSVKIFRLRIISTALQIRLNFTSKYRDIFRRALLPLVLSLS